MVAKKRAHEAEQLHKEADEKFQEALKEIDRVKEERIEKQEELKKLNSDHDEYFKVYEKNLKEFKDLEKRDLQLQEKIKHTKAKGKNMVSELEGGQKETCRPGGAAGDNYRRKSMELQEKKESLESKRTAAEENLAKVMGKINKETEIYQKEKEEIQTKLLELQKGVNDAKAAREMAQSEYDQYMRRDKAEKVETGTI